jgi:hypothetical protein
MSFGGCEVCIGIEGLEEFWSAVDETLVEADSRALGKGLQFLP